ncbi:MAG: AAA family ATPase [Elusimicrobiota bacterium]
MSYYERLGLKREPFSTSPDPAFFYRSNAHESALRRLEISIRLRRGLSLVLGDVGTGKTTLSRTLVQNFSQEKKFEVFLVLNPRFESEFQFLNYLCRLFRVTPPHRSLQDCLEVIEKYLFRKGVEEGKTVVLLVDEGQNLTPSLIELLRTLLNYETNEYKLLQLVIVAQLEILTRLKRIRNFMDRVSMKYLINPLDLAETGEMIRYRLKVAEHKGPPLFTDGAVEGIHHASQGYPRKVTYLAHNCLRNLVVRDRKVADAEFIRQILKEEAAFA